MQSSISRGEAILVGMDFAYMCVCSCPFVCLGTNVSYIYDVYIYIYMYTLPGQNQLQRNTGNCGSLLLLYTESGLQSNRVVSFIKVY